MKLFSIDSPLVRFFSRLCDLIIVNLLFLICSLPIITIGASITAVYRVMIDLQNDSGNGVIKSFFQAFRSNFKNATIIFLILLGPFILFSYEIWFYLVAAAEKSSVNALAFALPMCLLLFVLSYVYPLTAQFDNNPLQTIKNAFLISIMNFPVTLLIVILNVSPLLLLLFFTGFFLRAGMIILVMGFSSIAYVNTSLLLPVFRKYILQFK